jgi:hypothetical protein
MTVAISWPKRRQIISSDNWTTDDVVMLIRDADFAFDWIGGGKRFSVKERAAELMKFAKESADVNYDRSYYERRFSSPKIRNMVDTVLRFEDVAKWRTAFSNCKFETTSEWVFTKCSVADYVRLQIHQKFLFRNGKIKAEWYFRPRWWKESPALKRKTL